MTGSRTKTGLLKFFFRKICYTCLLAGGFLFSNDAISQYREGKTAFEVSQEPLTLEDLPIITICYEGLNYRFINEWNDSLNSSVQYKSQYPVSSPMHVFDDDWHDDWAFSYTLEKTPNKTFSIKRMRASLSTNDLLCDQFSLNIELIRRKMLSNEITVVSFFIEMNFEDTAEDFTTNNLNPVAYITSQSNAFGVAGFDLETDYDSFQPHQPRWYDGKVRRIEIGQNAVEVVVTDVQEIVHISGTCSEKSFYQSLADHFVSKEFTSHFNISEDDCPKKYKCLPSTWAFDHPTCNTPTYKGFWGFFDVAHQRVCTLQAMRIVKQEMKNEFGKFSKSCNIKQFNTDMAMDKKSPYKSFSKNTKDLGFSFKYTFKVPHATDNIWTSKFVKTVHKEYYIMTEIGVIGTVGGTLGLFVGLSFLDSGSFFASLVQALVLRLVRKKCKKV